MPALATGVDVTYSQIGSRGEPWTSVNPSRSRRSGSPSSHARVSFVIVALVHSLARRASTLKDSISGPPAAAASWFPRTPIAPTSRSRATTSSGSGPYPTTSPSCQTSSTDGIAASTASSASRLAWISESTATRTPARVARPTGSERTAAPLRGIAREPHVDRSATRDDDEAVVLEPGDASRDDARPAGPQRPHRAVRRGELVLHGMTLPRDEHAAGRDERQAQLHELGEPGDCAGGHRRPCLAITRVARDGLGPLRLGSDAALEPGGPDDRPQELDLLADGVDEQGPTGRERGRERDAGKSAARAQVQQTGDPEVAQERSRREAVEHMQTRGLGRHPDRGQVDRLGPGEEQADV